MKVRAINQKFDKRLQVSSKEITLAKISLTKASKCLTRVFDPLDGEC